MKHLLFSIAMIASLNVSTASARESNPLHLTASVTLWPTALVALTAGGLATSTNDAACSVGAARCKVAIQLIEDSQNYLQSGDMSALLSQAVKEIQAQDESLSQDQAVDEITVIASQILK